MRKLVLQPRPSESQLSKSTSLLRFTRSLTLSTFLVAAAAAVPPSAHAQSCGEPPVVHSSYPADGATRVPTNAPLFVYGPELDARSPVTLQDESGVASSVDVQAVDGGVLVDAFLGLQPDTTYELTVSLPGEEAWSATFTTGSGPAARAQLRAPEVTVSVIEQDRGSCGVVSAICVIGSGSANRAFEVLVGDEVLSLAGDEPRPAFPAEPTSIASNECIEVRVREPGGSVSESTRLCGAALGRFELAANAAAPTSCQAYRSAPAAGDDDEDEDSDSDSGGCALGAPGSSSTSGALWLGLFSLTAALYRRASRVSLRSSPGRSHARPRCRRWD